MMPSYLVIGAQKCATSTLCDLMRQHPQVFMTLPKEPQFFARDHVWQRGLPWYESLFEGAEGCKAVGEGSTNYTQAHLYPHAAERIARHLPDVRLIYIVRDPVERIRSQWIHLTSKGSQETLPFNEAVRTREQYIDHSRYKMQIDRYRQYYDDKRILILFFEDFVRDQLKVLRHVFEFLEVDPDYEIEDPYLVRHRSADGRMDRAALKMLRQVGVFRSMIGHVPAWARGPFRPIFKKPVEGRPEWDEQTLRWVIDRVHDESVAFLERYDRPIELWPSLCRDVPAGQ